MKGDVENNDKSMEYEDDGEPEQVSTLDPIAYELRASMNTPNLRTTFYGMQQLEETKNPKHKKKIMKKHHTIKKAKK